MIEIISVITVKVSNTDKVPIGISMLVNTIIAADKSVHIAANLKTFKFNSLKQSLANNQKAKLIIKTKIRGVRINTQLIPCSVFDKHITPN